MKFAIYILTMLASFHSIIAQQASEGTENSYLILPKIEVIPIKDSKLDRQYELYVKLPEGYSDNDSIQYPVIYLYGCYMAR
ncbi:MAG: hypothetical protein AAF391_05450 [Bacteroidota bacterium]